jgi:putative transcriptional regulator
MIVNYDKLWKILIDKKMKRTDLIKQGKISSNVLARMGREEPVSLESIGKVCLIPDCSIDDILEFRYTDDEKKNAAEVIAKREALLAEYTKS